MKKYSIVTQDLAYGAREAGQIKHFSILIFKVELVGTEKPKIEKKSSRL